MDSRVLSSVVLPVPVPPLIRNARRESRRSCRIAAPASGRAPAAMRSSSVKTLRDGTRRDRQVPGAAGTWGQSLSEISRRPSASRLKPITSEEIAAAGNSDMCGKTAIMA